MRNNIIARRARLMAFAAPQAAVGVKPSPQTEISALQAFPLREPVSKRSYAVLKLQTQGGLTGYGECPEISIQDLAQVSAAVRGKDVTQFEVVRQQLKNASAGVMAALNVAMLDVVGKVAKAPIYQVLGGPTRFKCRALAPLAGSADAELTEAMKRAIAAGYRAFVVPVPPPPFRNQGPAWLQATRKRLEGLRAAGGQEVDFVLDGGGGLVPGDASSAAAELEKFHLLWFDEPCPLLNPGAVKKIARESVTPLGFGRNFRTGGEFQQLLREDSIDVIRPDISLNGISEIRRMAVIAETYYIAAAPYHDGGPIATAAALQLAASIPNFFIQQIPNSEAEDDRRMRAEIAGAGLEAVKDGFAALPTGPGLGITVNEEAFKKYRGATA